MALWAGRFSKEIDAGVNAFNSSIAFDARMYRHDIQGSIAHATMLGDCGIISKEDSSLIIQGLKEILADLDSGKLEFDPNAEDIHMFVEGFDYVVANDIADLEAKLDDTVCAVMLEYIQGEGGVNALEQAFVDAVFEKCAARDILVMADEVQTGVGRTGTFLAGEQFGHKADVTTLAKGIAGGLPMGACLANEKCADVLDKGSHGSTFGGNPVCCAGGLAVLNTVTAPGFLDEVQRKAKLLREKLAKLDGVAGVSGLGLMVGIALKDKKAIDVANAALEQGLLVLTAKDKVRLLPPLTITDEEIEKGVAILADVLSK